MANLASTDRRASSGASQTRRLVDEVLNIARAEHAGTTVSGGSKPHVTLTKHVADYSDMYFRSMLSGIEYATRGHFDTGRAVAGCTEFMLRGRLIDVTVRCWKEGR